MKLFRNLLSLFFIVSSLLILSYCSTNEPDLKTVEPDIIKVSSKYYGNFKVAYDNFLSTLSVPQKDLLDNYVKSLETDMVNGKIAGATCQCAQGQNSCTASGVFGDCCICWWPNTQDGACGVYFGVPSCQTKERQIEGRSESEEIMVIFYAKRFSEMLEFSTINEINIKEIKSEFNRLKSFAVLN